MLPCFGQNSPELSSTLITGIADFLTKNSKPLADFFSSPDFTLVPSGKNH